MAALIGVTEVMKILDCSKAKAYQVMRELNQEKLQREQI